jgi:hypothetical protein
MRIAWNPSALAVLISTSLAVLGCAAHAGHQATAGALEEIREARKEIHEAGGPPAMHQIAGNATRGTLEAIDEPLGQEQLSRAVGIATESALSTAMETFRQRGAWGGGPPSTYGTTVGSFGGDLSSGFALGISRQLQIELGPDGTGPLGKSLSGMAQEMSGAVANGVVAELSPVDNECTGPDRKSCIDRRVYDVSRLAAIGAADGVAHSLRFPVLVLTFLGGFVVALIATAAFRRATR